VGLDRLVHQHLAALDDGRAGAVGMIVFGAIQTGADGKQYGVRYLLTREELAGLQAAGLVGEVDQIEGLQSVADGIVAMYERDAVLALGRSVQ